jgi:histidinol-phosphate aminotransferase
MQKQPRFTGRPHIAQMAPYALAAFDIPKHKRLISLAQNESLRPPSPLVIDAINKRQAELALYPDPDWGELRHELSQLHNIDVSTILCGAGSMELIQCLAHGWLDNSSTVITTRYAYAFINTVAQYTNAAIHHVEEDQFSVSVDNLINAIDDKTTMVFVANPGNPTGTRIPRTELRRLRDNMPEDTLLVIDEAYAEFSDHCDDTLFDLTETTPTAVLRTFSKAYGLAGMRVGWGVFAPSVAEQVRKLLNPNNISVLSQVAAVACVQDQTYMQETCRQTQIQRDALINVLVKALHGTSATPPVSHTNFVLIPFETPETATRIDASLRAQGMVLRNMAGYGLPHCHRLTVVNETDMTLVRQCLLAALAEEQSK